MLARSKSTSGPVRFGTVLVAGLLTFHLARAQDAAASVGAAPAVEASAAAAPDTAPTVAEPEASLPQAPMRHAPRFYELALTGSNAVRADLPLGGANGTHHPFGVGGRLRLGWRVGGLHGGSASWVGFEMAFVGQPSGTFRSSEALAYGIFVKHAFRPAARVHPYLAYGLGAAQVWVHQVSGREIGHQTRLGLGFDVDVRPGTTVGLGIDYVMVVMPTFGTSTSPTRVDGFDWLTLVFSLGYESGLVNPR